MDVHDLIKGALARPADDDKPAEVEAAIARLDRTRRAALQALTQMAAERSDLLLTADDATIEAADRKAARAQRDIERIEHVMPDLNRLRQAAEDRRVRAAIARHKAALREAAPKLQKALDAALAANQAIAQVYAAADADLRGRASLHLPNPRFMGMLTADGIALWRGNLHRGMAEPEPARPARESGIWTVRFVLPSHNFNPGESAGFPEAEARALVGSGRAVWADVTMVPAAPADPRQAPMPKPINGLVRLRGLAPYWAGYNRGFYQPDEIYSLPPAEAEKAVRGGRAAFVADGESA